MTEARVGWGGQFWLHNGTALTKLLEVTSFGLPTPEVETIEATHLESPGRRREYITGMIEDGELEVVMNYVPGSATDLLINTALEAGTARAFKAVVPNATVGRNFQGTCIVTGLDRGTIEADGKMEATMTVRLTGATTEAAVS
ncbi:phage tail tube protein [Sphingomonas sp.]|jgi:predicted secreted protein|uniref:phage tail tube protein n=1 Tax=Sphingomonas sp. TaxID=28214 RepID=UPI002D7EFBA2|nr:phage tail tube protein [Sphingomonas sp.]HEU0045080.1 phage tail tube protein [Sphingomonas sp.]